MTRRIFKYDLLLEEKQILSLPYGAKILRVGEQNGMPYLWAEVDPHAGHESRIIRLIGTGDFFDETKVAFIGHVRIDWFEAWVYEQFEGKPEGPNTKRIENDLKELKSRE